MCFFMCLIKYMFVRFKVSPCVYFQVLCVITAPITLIIKSQQDASYAFVALAIILCSFLSMGLIFGPKVCTLNVTSHED